MKKKTITKKRTITEKYYTHELKDKILTRAYWKTDWLIEETFSIENGKQKLTRTTKTEINTEILNLEEYSLKKIKKEKIYILRDFQRPFFLLKENQEYFVTSIPENMNLVGEKHICNHLCSSCARLYPNECAKVLDIGKEKRIEKYPFIGKGFETSSNRIESFVVNECSRYKKSI